ncbi:hypothetical protein DMN91_011871 [Ooceraea biroi]|uniref:Peptidase C45 hydrolase domain-containing protein n=1 Tax=Ooceraea biroi TaxID=2015173 RepID=A0A3L8D7R0_OOCBI|nr:hypothetical protein DMN91_011871 [Ooceraea biroi]
MATLESYTNGSAGTNGGIGRRNAVPIIHVRGTHYEIGFDIGRTFAKMIQDFVSIYAPLNETYLPLFATEKGRMVYEETLDVVKKQFPQYLFLMHLDDIISNATNGTQANVLPVGCSTIICNQPGHEIIGHNEDALSETLNHWYLVRAHVVEVGCKEEKFTSLSYAGFLPGYTMGYNHHGLVYSINTLSAAVLRSGKIRESPQADPCLAQETLRNEGCGAAEGFSVNMTFLAQEGDRMFHNAEVGPAEADSARSQLNVLTVSPGENTYLRLKVAEVEGLIIQSSIKRMKAISKHPPAKCRQDVIDILSDQTDDEFRVYQEIGCDDYVKTLATGIFDCKERTWSIYTDKPQCNEPILVIPMQLRDPQSGKANK